MKAKPVLPREQAHRDVEDAVAHYLAEGAETAALSLSGILCVRHGMTMRSMSAEQDESEERHDRREICGAAC